MGDLGHRGPGIAWRYVRTLTSISKQIARTCDTLNANPGWHTITLVLCLIPGSWVLLPAWAWWLDRRGNRFPVRSRT